ncbi:MAG: glycosyltransferase family 4 protein [Candidatus Diapherotrites archaeon]|nr:glycosyltransferase family 4 protein [Candidatus Diapherotrites archaeon]
MNILIIHKHFTLPGEPGSSKPFDLAVFLAEAGHTVWVLAGNRNYMTDKKRGVTKVVLRRNLQVIYCNVLGSHHAGFFGRLLAQQSFMLGAFFASFKIPRIDVVLASSPPLQSGLAGLAIAKARRARFVLEVRDLWPLVPVLMGALRNGLLARLGNFIERLLYRSADRIVCVTNEFRKEILKTGIGSGKVLVIPNGVSLDLFAGKKPAKRRWKKFVVMYAGPMGRFYGLQRVLEAAVLLRHDKELLFVLVGDGSGKAGLKAFAKTNRLGNVLFLPVIPKAALPELLMQADVCVNSMIEKVSGLSFIPNKCLEYLACGKPVVSNSGALSGILKRSSGIVVAETARGFADAVIRIKKDARRRERLGRKGRAFAEAHFDRKKLLRRYARELESIPARPA